MRYAIPILSNRVAPRCTFAEAVLLISIERRRIAERSEVPLEGTTWVDLAHILAEHRVDTLICSGISPSTRQSLQESLHSREITIIDNVTGTTEQILEALTGEGIRPGFGLIAPDPGPTPSPAAGTDETPTRIHRASAVAGVSATAGSPPTDQPVSCLECMDRRCLRGERCDLATLAGSPTRTPTLPPMMEAALDIACESERTLCRLAELVYFCVDMRYERLGVAYCTDLEEPAAILTGVLRRFFEVVPVCCKIGGLALDATQMQAGLAASSETAMTTACNPAGQAAVMNSMQTDLNVIVGLCVGADCVFTRESAAPVTTVFVKDKSLANNPIGAVYSHYYLEDI